MIFAGTTLYRTGDRDACLRSAGSRVDDSRADASRSVQDARSPAISINPINTGWMLLGAFLVFGMQAGFTMLEAGFCRNRETVNVLVECVFDTCVCGLLHWGWGFAFMFGAGNGFIGWHDPNDPTKSWFFLQDVDAMTTLRRDRHPGPRALALPVRLRRLRLDDLLGHDDRPHRLLRRHPLLRSASPASSIRSSATGLGPGRLPRHDGLATGHFLPSLGMNFHDFAGSTVVHSIGGWVAIAGGICLGRGSDASSSVTAAARCCRTI